MSDKFTILFCKIAVVFGAIGLLTGNDKGISTLLILVGALGWWLMREAQKFENRS